MSPLMMRFFTLVGIALAAASMQLKARADPLGSPHAQQMRSATCSVDVNLWRST